MEINEIDTIIEELIRKEDAAVNTGAIDKKRLKKKRRLQNKLKKGHETFGRRYLKMWGRWRGGSEEEKEKEQ